MYADLRCDRGPDGKVNVGLDVSSNKASCASPRPRSKDCACDATGCYDYSCVEAVNKDNFGTLDLYSDAKCNDASDQKVNIGLPLTTKSTAVPPKCYNLNQSLSMMAANDGNSLSIWQSPGCSGSTKQSLGLGGTCQNIVQGKIWGKYSQSPYPKVEAPYNVKRQSRSSECPTLLPRGSTKPPQHGLPWLLIGLVVAAILLLIAIFVVSSRKR